MTSEAEGQGRPAPDVDAIADLIRRVRHLEDRAAIAQLISSYGPSVDSGSAEPTAALWSSDGMYAFSASEMSDEVVVLDGAAAIAAMVDGPGHQEIIRGGAAHVLSAPHIVVSGDSAGAIAYSLLLRRDASGTGFVVARMGANRWDLERDAGGWSVRRRTQSMLDGREASRDLLRAAAGHRTI